MADLSKFNPNAIGNPFNNVFGLPFKLDDAEMLVVSVPWEATIWKQSGTARCRESIMQASLDIDLHFHDAPNLWERGIYLTENPAKVLLKSDYLRKEAELYVDFTYRGNANNNNEFMIKNLNDINNSDQFINEWVYDHTIDHLLNGKLVGLLGGAQSICIGYLKALSEKYTNIGILQIDAHCDLRDSYQGFTTSHASSMYNALNAENNVTKLVQVGVRSYSKKEAEYLQSNQEKITTFFQDDVAADLYEGKNWASIVQDIIAALPELVYISFDIDGLDAFYCPNSSNPVPGGLTFQQATYLIKQLARSGKKIIGFDLSEIGVGENSIDAEVGANLLWHLCNWTLYTNPK